MITKFEASGAEVRRIIEDKLGPAVEGEEMGHAILALMSLSIIVMKPDVELEKLQEILTGMNQLMILHLAEPNTDEAGNIIYDA